ncbi:MAG: hypothetical protein LBS38_01870 [Endomicrobium sp.]|nr:hypothetical protein [Endomicrobium sp.]
MSSIAKDEAVSNIVDYLKRRKSGRGCYIFGSQYGLLLVPKYINCLKTLGIKFISVVIKDNQNPEVKKLKNVFPDINIIGENDFLNNYKNEDIILSSIDWKEDKNWLIKNGISRDKIVVLFDFFYP